MTIFPELIPSTRTYSPGEFPHSVHGAYDGSQARVRHSNTVLGGRLRLFFPAITSAELLTVISHYSSQRGRFLPFAIPDELLSGINTPADFTPAGHQWRYAARPAAEDISVDGDMPSNLHNLTVELETVPPENTIVQGARLRARANLTAGSALLGTFIDAYAVLDPGSAFPVVSLNVTATLAAGRTDLGADFEASASLMAGLATISFDTILLVTATLIAGAAGAPATDPDFADVAALVPMNGTDGGTTFTDVGPNAITITAFGATTQTDQSKWGGSSGYFDGSGQILVSDTSSAFAITGDFTAEFWVYFLSLTGTRTLLHVHAGSAQGLHVYTNGDALLVDNGLVADYSSSTGLLSLNTWTYIAVSKSGSTLYIAKDSTVLNSRTPQDYGTPDRFKFARYNAGGVTDDANCYANDLRITNGVARFTTTVTAPAAAFPTG